MLTNDSPINTPEDDHFGIDPFAQALAKAITMMPSPEGVVIGVNGPWGSGKSSALNLILHHLKPLIDEKTLKVIRFSPWWLSGTEAITAAFLSDLESAIGDSVGEAVLKVFRNVASRVQRLGKVLGAAADLAAPGASKIVDAVDGLLGNDQSIEAQHKKVSESLAAVDCRFLVIIDDIDRLAPNEAVEVFKLVKSVGQLSNVIYILAFDRNLAERVVSEQFPSEGPHYLEKILQASFEVPAASPSELREAFLDQVNKVCGTAESEDKVHFINIMLEAVTPFLKSPRDLKRLIGMLQVTWPAVASEVNRADFVAIEAFRLFAPGLYQAIRANSDRLTGIGSSSADRRQSDLASEYSDLLLKDFAEAEKPRLQRALRRIFPRLDAIWGNVQHSSDITWHRYRRICAAQHFPTYFRFAIGDDIVSAQRISALTAKSNDRVFVQETLRAALGEKTKAGKTRVPAYLLELRVHAPDIAKDHIGPFLSALFEIADELDVQEDEERGFGMVNNNLRIHWLVSSLVGERLEAGERTQILRAAMEGASLRWFCSFAERCGTQHRPKDNGTITPEDERFVDQETAEQFIADALERLRVAAKDGSLTRNRNLLSLLWEWVRLSPDGLDEVRPVVNELFGDDGFVMQFALSAVGITWSQSMGFDGMGDLVARGTLQVKKDSIEPFIDPEVFLTRLREMSATTTDPGRESFRENFLEAYEKSGDQP